jgi:hypothetical protein
MWSRRGYWLGIVRRGRAASRFRASLALAGLLALGLSSACASSSSPSEPSGGRPAWLQSLIAQIESEPVTNPPSSIVQYRYRGQTVYFRPSRCCDIQSDVYDQGGSLICHADGGITGGGDGRCSDFFSTRAGEQLVWQDSRR